MIRVGIVGGAGYTGMELLRLLSAHPHAEITAITSRSEAGKAVSDYFPFLRGKVDIPFTAPDSKSLVQQCDVIFFATPHGVAMDQVPSILAEGGKVIDLGADFRLKNTATFQAYYGMEHRSLDALSEAVYGLPETRRANITNARLIANPGCYPTAVQLGYLPLVEHNLILPDSLIADCKSGATGAGRSAKQAMLFGEVSENFRAYALGTHRHQPEIEQELSARAHSPIQVLFSPHLVPMLRGISCTLYARLKHPTELSQLQSLFEERYTNEPFVDVMPPQSHPETRSVRGSNLCRLAVHKPRSDTVAVISVIDNLVKGASGQAIHNMNLMFGLPEATGLEQTPITP